MEDIFKTGGWIALLAYVVIQNLPGGVKAAFSRWTHRDDRREQIEDKHTGIAFDAKDEVIESLKEQIAEKAGDLAKERQVSKELQGKLEIKMSEHAECLVALARVEARVEALEQHNAELRAMYGSQVKEMNAVREFMTYIQTNHPEICPP